MCSAIITDLNCFVWWNKFLYITEVKLGSKVSDIFVVYRITTLSPDSGGPEYIYILKYEGPVTQAHKCCDVYYCMYCIYNSLTDHIYIYIYIHCIYCAKLKKTKWLWNGYR